MPGPAPYYAATPAAESADAAAGAAVAAKEKDSGLPSRVIDRTMVLRRPARVDSSATEHEVVGKGDVRGRTAADASRLFWKGYGLYWQGKYGEALVLFEAAVQVNDKDARFWYYRSLSESAISQVAQAGTSLEKAVDLHARGLPEQEKISQALERVQGPSRLKLREALDLHRSTP